MTISFICFVVVVHRRCRHDKSSTVKELHTVETADYTFSQELRDYINKTYQFVLPQHQSRDAIANNLYCTQGVSSTGEYMEGDKTKIESFYCDGLDLSTTPDEKYVEMKLRTSMILRDGSIANNIYQPQTNLTSEEEEPEQDPLYHEGLPSSNVAQDGAMVNNLYEPAESRLIKRIEEQNSDSKSESLYDEGRRCSSMPRFDTLTNNLNQPTTTKVSTANINRISTIYDVPLSFKRLPPPHPSLVSVTLKDNQTYVDVHPTDKGRRAWGSSSTDGEYKDVVPKPLPRSSEKINLYTSPNIVPKDSINSQVIIPIPKPRTNIMKI